MAEEFTAKFKVDISDLKKNISDATKSIREANATFKAQTAGMDKWADNADGLSEKLKQLDSVLDAQKRILASYKGQLAAQQKAYDENGRRADELRKKLQELSDRGVSKSSEEYKKYKTALQNVTKEQENNEKAVDDLKIAVLNQEAAVKGTEREIRHYKGTLDNLDNATEEVKKDTDKANEGFTVLKGTLANLAAEAIKKAISGLKNLGKAAVDAYKEYDAGADNVIKATGATGEAAEKLKKTYKDVTQNVIGNLDEIGSTLGEVNTRFGFTDDELADATTAFQKFAKITGSDAVGSVQAVSRIMQKAGIPAKNYGKLLDSLAVAAQASGISVDDLTDTMDKVGTEMLGLGLDTDETIALLASFEKSGVNSSNALGGMRKAFQKWSKQGKDSKKEFQKVIDEIKKAPNKTKATQKAIEVFGNKAGPELAKAISEGKLEYKDFVDTLKKSTGAVNNTYEATQDGFDKVKLVIQGAKSEIGAYVSDIAKKYAPQIEAFAKKAVETLKKVISWVAANGKTLAGFAGAVAAAFGIKKVVDFGTAVGKTVKTIGGFVSAIKGVSGAAEATSFTGLLSPLGLVTAAVGGLAAAFLVARDNIEKEMEANYGLTDQQKKTVEAATNIKTSYDEMDKSRKDSMATIDSEFGYMKELKEEYNKLIDKNGKVKKGYEDRAEFILNQLAQSMGVERTEIDKVIEKNGKLGESIDKIIQKKQAEAILQANEAAYTEAIQKRNEALNTYQESVTTLGEAEENYKDTVAEVRAEREKISTAMLHASGNLDQYQYQLGQLDKKEQVAKKALEDAKKAVEDSEDAYVGYINTIENYEGLSASIISGDAKAIESSMQNIQENFVTAKTGTKRTLEEQLANAKKTYEDMKKAAASGMAGVTKEVVNNAADMVIKASRELEAFEERHRTTFQTTIADAVAAKDPTEKAGSSVGRAYWTSVASPENIGKTKAAGAELKDNAVSGASDTSGMRKNGENAAGGFIAGIRSKIHEAVAAAAELSRQATAGGAAGQKSASPSKLWEDEVGEMAGEGYIAGLNNMIMPAMRAAKNLVTDAIDAAAKQTVRGGGIDFSGFGQGLSRNVASAAGGISQGAATMARTSTFTQVINSPKPLTRIEIYRQTKNLLNLARMGA